MSRKRREMGGSEVHFLFAVENNTPQYDGLAMRISRFLITGGVRAHCRVEIRPKGVQENSKVMFIKIEQLSIITVSQGIV